MPNIKRELLDYTNKIGNRNGRAMIAFSIHHRLTKSDLVLNGQGDSF